MRFPASAASRPLLSLLALLLLANSRLAVATSAGYPHLKEQWEFHAQLVTTGATNVVLLFGILRSWQVGLPVDAFVGFAAMVTSVAYHTLQTLEGNNPHVFEKARFLGGTEGDWHRADNIFAITCIISFFAMPLQLVSPVWVLMTRMVPLCVVAISQCLQPWNFAYTIFPIIFFGVGFLVLLAVSRVRPRLQRRSCLYSGVTFILAMVFFFFGMDDANDYLRIKHGFWHIFIGAFVYFWTDACNPPHVVQTRRRLLFANAADAAYLLSEEHKRHKREPPLCSLEGASADAAVQMVKLS
ncbi:putative transmembrane protein [Toxoplasma gondii RUB]|uniref:Transmembrane protein n=11 Tax=Toxoplasma gondii TaxID=5811 RepID=A0A125YL47_TOXGG|nr:hypothetical protein TGGT1_226710 [Toxoplasma gondii GT1]ESS32612.1 putative transmembrane protein [Toxoplasma gondii VEG]KAF4640704.1 hypothetical protein TGRH88_046300 [Toxoplasma gondii]KFG42595.1 putative transmembrane protein [Toxoplasma gondii p89]KFG51838.1 putative transmembrane protein [Toxoplasma gondii FOU]KFG60931.1 putative transmembrane protein [Toxoplasma gondii RUB]KFH13091.1 putative transmembrane protein [Toxoplasma gondii VAND]PIM04104.1 putative transmembrane protein [